MSYKLNPHWLKSLIPAQQKFALESRGAHFLFKFLFKKGHHLFIVGTTESGKTQKGYWLVRWIKTTKETVVWLDSAKNGEILPLLTLGTPVRIVCPKGCNVIIKEWSKEEKKYVKIKDHPEVVTAPDPGSSWWAVKKGYINIFCFRRAFEKSESSRVWMGELFQSLSLWTGKNIMPRILPLCIVGDEAHWFLAGEKITSNSERNQLSDLITELSLEDRAYGIRLVLMAQGFKNLPPGTRENLINVLLCRGAKVESTENNTLSKFNPYTSGYRPDQGMFVYAGGFTYPQNFPWPFPYFPKPKMKIEYTGEFDNPTTEQIQEKEILDEMEPDLNKYQSLIADLQGYKIPVNMNRYDLLDIKMEVDL